MTFSDIQITPDLNKLMLHHQGVQQDMQDRADRVVAAAKAIAPYDTGLYRDGIAGVHPDHPDLGRRHQRAKRHLGDVDVSHLKGIHREAGQDGEQLAIADAPYSRYLEWGTSRMHAFHTMETALDAARGNSSA